MYLIKQQPEDFIVEEQLSLLLKEEGDYSYWTLEKRNRNTLDALLRIADALRIKPQQLGHAGNKDKHALTRQAISFFRVPIQRIHALVLPGIALSFLGYGDRPIHLGQHQANLFRIIVRNLESAPTRVDKVLNLFGGQRFGGNNAEVGKLLVNKRFKEACALLDLPQLNRHLAGQPSDFVGAMRTIPKQQLKLYVHAYQSAIWNECAKEAAKRVTDSKTLPIVGFATNLAENAVDSIIREQLAKEGVSPRDFIVRGLPDISSEGGERQLFMDVDELSIGELEPDEWHPGMKRCLLSFTLGPGSYATVLIDALCSGMP